MSISSVTSKVVYVGDGATLIFAYPFKIFAEGDLTVSEYFTATGSFSVLALNSDYIVDGVGVAAGGNVTLSGSYTCLSTGSQLVIQRIMDLTQEVDYVENDPFPAQTLENALDKITMVSQQLQEQVNRAVKSDISTTSAGVIYIDADASASSAVVAIAQVVLCSASALAAASSATVAVAQTVLSSSHAAVSVSSATVSVAKAVLASNYAGAIDFSKDTDGTLTSNSDILVATQKAIKTYVGKDTDGTLTSNSDLLIATQKATKTYADTKETIAFKTGDWILSTVTTARTGWTNVSSTYSNKFMRINATPLTTGGADTHTHGNYTETVYGVGVGTAGYGDIGGSVPVYSEHFHGIASPTGNNVPAYVQVVVFQKD